MLHINNVENVETETSKDGFDLGEESSNKTEEKDKFGTFEANKSEKGSKNLAEANKKVVKKTLSV